MADKKWLTRVAPVRAGVVMGVLYAILGLIFAPFMLIAALAKGEGGAFAGALIMAVLSPILYAAAGFLGGIITAWLYNLVAKWTGGLEFETSGNPGAEVLT